ncbi:uncharacterized protein FOBCDRAFT_255382 [Fusarium oxysporum Fo47]|nr:uncharacterized protein FOBCDRAFT_255382 [Fusarium oxysporum Fo47]WJG34457.1 hypothetical protein FOBCDRAFT_255382 [Fusarium oxysporum Fo47]
MGEAGILRSPERHNHTVFANKHRKAEPRSILGGASSIVCSNLNTHVPVYLSWFLRTLGCQWTYRLRRQFNGLCGVSTHMCAWATILSYVAAILFDFREPDMREDGVYAATTEFKTSMPKIQIPRLGPPFTCELTTSETWA